MPGLTQWWPALLVVLALGDATPARAELPLHEFSADTPARLADSHAGRPWIFALWSVYCEPCRHELVLLGEVKQRHPDLAIELVSTDFIDQRPIVLEVLADYRLDGVRSWSFDSDFAEPIRFAIDPDWRGELPRSYLHDGHGGVRAISGMLKPETLQVWLRELGMVDSESAE